MTARKKAYARAGVDVDLGNRLKRQIQSLVKQTHGPQVLSKIGGFGGFVLAKFPGVREAGVGARIGGVGAKIKNAFGLKKNDNPWAGLGYYFAKKIPALGAL